MPTTTARSPEIVTASPGSDDSVTAEDAFDLLLAFIRLARSVNRDEEIPSRVQTLLQEGVLAARHMTTFAIVAMHEPLSVSELARREGCATTTASLLATQLADAGLVERREDSLDRRRTVITISPSYRKDGKNVLTARLTPLRRALARMGPERSRAMMDGLAILAEEIG